MIDKILVHPEPVCVGIEVNPVRLLQRQGISLLKEQNVRGDVGASRVLEGVVGQTHSAQQLRTLGDIFAHNGALLVHRALGGHESDDAAGTHLVQRFGEEIVVD